MDKLKNTVKEHFEKPSLNERQFDSLLQLQEEAKWYHQIKYTMPIAASFVLVLLMTLTNFMGSNKSTLQLIADEVIYNHKKNLPSEFLVDNMSGLNTRLLKLDFKVIDSPSLASYDVIGGRYCSIQGLTAAQIKIKEKGIVSTLYQSNFLDVDKKQLPYTARLDGVMVKVWIENNTLHAQATSIPK
jgi:hypothetical protein